MDGKKIIKVKIAITKLTLRTYFISLILRKLINTTINTLAIKTKVKLLVRETRIISISVEINLIKALISSLFVLCLVCCLNLVST